MKRSTRIGVSGARPHRYRAINSPIDSKIWIFMLIEFYIINSIGRLAMNILYVYIHSVINEVWDLV
jgi:hypothetical protein